MKILWVDDQLDVAKTLASCLKQFNYDIDFASNGEEALSKLKDYNYDILLTDLAMPPSQWGGLWLLEKLKDFPTRPQTIVVSGEGSQAETIKALRLGANDYVTKENIAEELPAQIQSLLEILIGKTNIESLILLGETAQVEFKSTLRFNIHAKKNDNNIEHSSFKTIAAFLNTSGGTLLIGLDDAGKILGLDLDNFPSLDKFQLHFWNIFRQAIGTEFSEFIKTDIVKLGSQNIFSVFCKASNRPVFLRWKMSGEQNYQDLFYIRAGPQTDLLSTKQVINYLQDHFPHLHR